MKRRLLSGIVFLLLIALLGAGSSFRAFAAKPLLGDVDGDGRVSALDYAMLKRHVMRTRTLPAKSREMGDVDGDGRITAMDYLLVKRHVLKTYDLHADHTYDHHLFMKYRGKGNCESLTGKVSVLLVFVNDTESAWDNAAKEEAQIRLCEEMVKLAGYAHTAGAELSLEYGEMDVTLSLAAHSYNTAAWENEAAEAMGFASVDALQTCLEEEWEVGSVPVVFLLNKAGRAVAYYTKNKAGAEYLTMYASDYSPFCHELLHLYGAQDYYYPACVAAAANGFLKNSIMNTGDAVDPLTAYTVGWTNVLSYEAKGFLDAVSSLTEKELEEASKAERFTGYGTKTYPNGDVYEGYLELGIPHGLGEYRFADGSVYLGEFAGGIFHGMGRMEWAGGAVYEGDFVSNVRTGEGTYWWPNGDRYEGEFLEGKLQGYGTYYYASGDVQSGYWEYGVYRSN